MIFKSFKVFTLLSIFSLAGCATPVTQTQIANADYGTPPPKNYEVLAKTAISRDLIDPTSPIFEIGKPSKGYFHTSPVFGTYEMFGWKVCGSVNSKNRFGGYVGAVPFIVLFKDGAVAQKVVGESADHRDGFSIVNPRIREACAR